jgi:hypothetical protein
LEFTEFDVEKTIQSNHCGHFLLTGLLLKFLKKSDDPRIINVSSEVHKHADNSLDNEKNAENFNSRKFYAISIAANTIFTEDLYEFFSKLKFDDKLKIKAACLSPGLVRSEFFRLTNRRFLFKFIMTLLSPILYIFAKDEKIGAQTQINLCHIDKEDFESGEYYKDLKVSKKHDNIMEFNLPKQIYILTYTGLINSKVYLPYDEPDINQFFKFFKDKYYIF